VVERAAQQQEAVAETAVQRLHALLMGGGKTRVRPTPYRDGQSVIWGSRSSGIVSMPSEAKDVPPLMKQLVAWLSRQD
jgi:Fic family protein